MLYHSTRGLTPPHSFSEAVEAGLAADGGLFLPESLPDIRGRLAGWEKLSYPELAAEFFTLVSIDCKLTMDLVFKGVENVAT